LDITYAVRANKNPPYSFKAGSMSEGILLSEPDASATVSFLISKISPSGRSLFFSARHHNQMKSAD